MAVKMYVAYHRFNQHVVGGTTMQVSGDFLSSEVIDITSGGRTNEAPLGADYADVWADGDFYVKLGSSAVSPSADVASKPVPARTIVQIQNLRQLGSEIEGYALT